MQFYNQNFVSISCCLNTSYTSQSLNSLPFNNMMPLSQIIPLKPLLLLLGMTDQVPYPDKDTEHMCIPPQSLLYLITARSKSHQ